MYLCMLISKVQKIPEFKTRIRNYKPNPLFIRKCDRIPPILWVVLQMLVAIANAPRRILSPPTRLCTEILLYFICDPKRANMDPKPQGLRH